MTTTNERKRHEKQRPKNAEAVEEDLIRLTWRHPARWWPGLNLRHTAHQSLLEVRLDIPYERGSGDKGLSVLGGTKYTPSFRSGSVILGPAREVSYTGYNPSISSLVLRSLAQHGQHSDVQT